MSKKIMSKNESKELERHLLYRKQMIVFTRTELKTITEKLIDFENTEDLKEQILESVFLLDNAIDYLDNAIDKIQKQKP